MDNNTPNIVCYDRASTSLSYTMSNITSVLASQYKRLFPNNFFNYTHVSTKTSLAEIKNHMNKKKVDFIKNRPIMLVEPNLDFSYDSSYDNTWYGERMYDNYSEVRRKNLKSIFSDERYNLDLEYLFNEYKMLVRYDSVLETYPQMLDVFNLVKNALRIEKPHYIRIKSDMVLPKHMMQKISDIVDIELGTQEFFDYLNSHSSYGISYRVKPGSGNVEYFMYDEIPIRINYLKANGSDGNREGFDKTDFIVSQEVEIVFTAPALYYLFAPSDLSQYPQEPMSNEVDINISNNDDMIPITTIQLNTIPEDDGEGRDLINHTLFEISDPDILVDETDITLLLSKDINDVIDYCNSKSIDCENIINIVLAKNDDILIPITDYEVSIKDRLVKTKVIDINATYRMFIYLDYAKTNSYLTELKSQYDRENKDGI